MKKKEHKSKSLLWRILLVLLSFSFSTIVQAQNITVTGSVEDQNGEPLIGVTVAELNTTNGAITDIDGNFSIKCVKGSTLKFSYIGYKDVTKVVTESKLKIVLIEDSQALDEVVVVGYGTQKKGSVTGSVTSVDAKAIEDFPSANLSSALAGRLSGVYITQGTGKPGTSASFSVRAKGTPNNSDPLYVIDGVVRDKMAFDALDASEVANISVLKDGASAAVYGARAANGVVLITTKKGGNAKPTINYTGTVGIDVAAMIPETLSAYEHAVYLNDRAIQGYLNNAIWNPNVEQQDPTTKSSWYTDDELAHFKTTDYSFLDDAWKTPWSTRHAINITGGTEKVRYFIGGSYFYNVGSFDNLKYSKYNFRASIDADVSKNFTVGLNISTDNRKDTKPNWKSDGDRDRMNDLYKGLLLRTKMIPSMIDGMPVGNFIEWHPLMLISEESGLHTKKWQNVNVNATAEYRVPFVKGLKLKVQYNRTLDNRLIKKVNFPYEMYNFQTAGTNNHYIDPSNVVVSTKTRDDGNYVFKENQLAEEYQLNLFVTYDRKFGNHDLSALFVYEQSEGDSEKFDAQRNKLITWEMPEFFGASGDASESIVGAGSVSESGRLSYVGRLNYAYADKYLLEAAFRVDGSTKFAPDQRWGFFPSAAAGWVISNESFWDGIRKTVSNLKIRVSYGLAGNDALGERFPYRSIVAMGEESGFYYNWNSQGKGPKITTYGNPNATWEEAKKLDVGLELGLFNALNIEAAYFTEDRTGIFMRRTSLPSSTGLLGVTPYGNIGRVKSHGVDLSAVYNKQFNKDWSLSLRGTFTFSRNEVVEKDEGDLMYDYMSVVGHPVNAITGVLVADGLFTSQEEIDNSPKQRFGNYTVGDIKYRDLNGDGIVDGNDVTTAGSPTVPEIQYGIGATVKWRRLDFSFMFQGASNVSLRMYNMHPFCDASHFGYGITQYIADNHWSEDNNRADAAYPRLTSQLSSNNTQSSTFYIHDAKYLRLKTVELGYTIKKLRVYLSGNNLFVISPFDYWDPEKGGGHGLSYPLQRMAKIGVQYQF